MLSEILLAIQVKLLSILSVIRYLICGINLNWPLNLNLIYKTPWAGVKSNSNGSVDVKMDGSVLEDKSSFKMLALNFSSKLNRGSYIISTAKTTSKKIWALIRFMKFLSTKVAVYIYKSTICPCMEYCCHVWAGAFGFGIGIVRQAQKEICRTVGPSLVASLEPLAHCRNVASLRLFYRYYILW